MGLLEGKTIIVTGAGGNIGQAYCRGFLAEGANVVAADLGDITDIAKVWNGGERLITVRANVLEQSQCDAMARAAIDAFDRIDGLVNNAGFFKSASFGGFMEIPVEEWDLCYQVNVRGTWQCCRAVYPYMNAQGSGSIVNIGSNTPYKGIPNFLHYSSSKMAIVGLSRALAREVGDAGIIVNTLCPDLIPDEDLDKKYGPASNERTLGERCLKRTQLPIDMIGAAVFLLSDMASFVTGQSLLVNGGSHFN